jgi:hypothetical protein
MLILVTPLGAVDQDRIGPPAAVMTGALTS